MSVLLVTRLNQEFSIRDITVRAPETFFIVSFHQHPARELKVDVTMRAYLLQRAPVRPVFSSRCPFCFRTTCTSQACKNGDTNAPLLFFLSHVCYCAASRAITHKRVKKKGEENLFLSSSLLPVPPP